MSDDFETLLRQWLRARAATDRAAVEAASAAVAALPPRHGPRRMLPLVASIAVIVGAIVVVPRLGGVGAEASPHLSLAPATQASEASNVPSEPPASPRPTPEPPWMRGAVAALGCDYRPTGLGATSTWSRGRLGTTDQPTPDAALAHLLDKTSTLYVAFPSAGFRRTDGGEAVAVYTYAWRGSTRAVVIVRSATAAGDGPWYVDDLAACDPSELDPAIEPGVDFSAWRDATGALADPATVREREDCYGGTQLRFDGRLYVWDPDHGLNSAYDPARLDAPFGDDVQLPADAVDTGYTGSGRALFLAADGTAAFMVRSDGVQRWPHVIGDDYQRTDCN